MVVLNAATGQMVHGIAKPLAASSQYHYLLTEAPSSPETGLSGLERADGVFADKYLVNTSGAGH
jgi:hypothetical protein